MTLAEAWKRVLAIERLQDPRLSLNIEANDWLFCRAAHRTERKRETEFKISVIGLEYRDHCLFFGGTSLGAAVAKLEAHFNQPEAADAECEFNSFMPDPVVDEGPSAGMLAAACEDSLTGTVSPAEPVVSGRPVIHFSETLGGRAYCEKDERAMVMSMYLAEVTCPDCLRAVAMPDTDLEPIDGLVGGEGG